MAGPHLIRKSQIPVYGVQPLDDGSWLELIRKDSSLALVRSDGQTVRTHSTVSHADKLFAPPSLEPPEQELLVLPTNIAEGDAKTKLACDLGRLFGQFFESSSTERVLCSAFILSTWFADHLQSAPILSLVGEPEHCRCVLQFLKYLCRRGLILEGATAQQFCCFDRRFQFTILLDHPNLTPRFTGMLRAAADRDLHLILARRAIGIFGPIVVCSDEFDPNDIVGSVLELQVGNLKRDLCSSETRNLFNTFQNRLFAYRLSAYKEVGQRLGGLHEADATEANNLARSLIACVIEPEDKAELRQVLQSHLGLLASQRRRPLPQIILEVLLVLCHKGDSKAYVGQVAQAATTLTEARGEKISVEARDVGKIFRGLRVESTRDRNGWKLRLLPEVAKRIHGLAFESRVLTPKAMSQTCELCAQLKMLKSGTNSSG